jgi:hypothetical protein
MLDQIEHLLRAGHWLGPAVLGALCYRLLIAAPEMSGDDFAGGVMLGTSALILTFAGVKMNEGKQSSLAPLVFGAMFLASWTMR